MTVTLPGPIQVLHIDDDPELVELTAAFLEREYGSFEIVGATSASEGLERLDADPPDCVVSDYNMPGMDGIELLQTVREVFPELPFILYTGRGSEAVASDAISAGVTDYLQKQPGSEQFELLANRIRNAVQGRYESERATRQEELRRLTEFAGDTGAFEIDYETGEMLMTEGLSRVVGLEEGERLSLSDAIERYPPEQRDAVREMLNRAVETGEQRSGTWNVHSFDGRERTVAVTVVPTGTDGDTTVLRGAVNDITEQTRRERELEQIETLFQHAQESLFLVRVGEAFTVERVNPTFREKTGLTRAELRGRTPVDIFGESNSNTT